MEDSAPDSYLNRMIRAAKLDLSLYEEVEADRGAFMQAMGVVILSSLAAGVGSVGEADPGVEIILLGTLGALLSWYIWSYLAYYIGTRVLPEENTRADYGQMLRTIGFSSSPGLIRIAGIIPGTTKVVFFFASVWMLVAMVIAVRQALDFTSTSRALGVCAIGWLVQAIISIFLLLTFFGGNLSAPGPVPAPGLAP